MRVPRAGELLSKDLPDTQESRAREDLLFRHLQMANGTYKTTGHGRLDDLNDWLLQNAQLPEAPTVLDVGVSSGATTVDLIEAISHRGLRPTGKGLDVTMEAATRTLPLGIELLFDANGNPLQIASSLGTWGRPTPGATSVRSAIGRLLFSLAKLKPLVRALGKGAPQPVRLLSSRARSCTAVEFVEHDVFVRNPDWYRQFDLVRAANILHRAYFTDVQLITAVANICSYLKIGGSLLIARTADEDRTTRGTRFVLEADGHLRMADRFQGGSDIEDLVVAHMSQHN